MNKIKSILITLFASAAAVITLTVGAMAATNEIDLLALEPDRYSESIKTAEVESYGALFNQAECSNLRIQGITPSSNVMKASLEAKSSSYNHNLKYVSINIRNTTGESKLEYDYGTGSSFTVTITPPFKLDRAIYIGTTYAGTDFGTEVSEYWITVNKK